MNTELPIAAGIPNEPDNPTASLSRGRKPRIDGDGGPGPLQRLKMLPDPAHDLLLELRSMMSQRGLIEEIRSRHGIEGLVPSRLSEFFSWLAKQRALRRMKEDMTAFRENFGISNPGATLDEVHEATLAHLLLKARAEDNPGLMRFMLGEIRRIRALFQTTKRVEIMQRRAALLEERLFGRMAPERRNYS